MEYIHSTYHWREVNWVGDNIEDLQVDLYPDADFGGCQATSKSTSGCYFCVTGPSTRFGLSAASKAQTVVSHSTPEAEIVSADYGLRTIGQPALTLWKTLLGWVNDDVKIIAHEDNAAMIQVMNTGKPYNERLREYEGRHPSDDERRATTARGRATSCS